MWMKFLRIVWVRGSVIAHIIKCNRLAAQVKASCIWTSPRAFQNLHYLLSLNGRGSTSYYSFQSNIGSETSWGRRGSRLSERFCWSPEMPVVVVRMMKGGRLVRCLGGESLVCWCWVRRSWKVRSKSEFGEVRKRKSGVKEGWAREGVVLLLS